MVSAQSTTCSEACDLAEARGRSRRPGLRPKAARPFERAHARRFAVAGHSHHLELDATRGPAPAIGAAAELDASSRLLQVSRSGCISGSRPRETLQDPPQIARARRAITSTRVEVGRVPRHRARRPSNVGPRVSWSSSGRAQNHLPTHQCQIKAVMTPPASARRGSGPDSRARKKAALRKVYRRSDYPVPTRLSAQCPRSRTRPSRPLSRARAWVRWIFGPVAAGRVHHHRQRPGRVRRRPHLRDPQDRARGRPPASPAERIDDHGPARTAGTSTKMLQSPCR